MPGPFDELSHLAQTYAAEDYMAQRKRLREARRRYIEEHECPRPHTITTKDANGNERTFSIPFQVGKRTYEGEYPQTPETAFQPQGIEASREDIDAIDKLIGEAEQFLAPGIYRESPHPEIRKGESHGEYCARVGSEYEQAAGANAIRRPVPGPDSVRRSTATDSSGVGTESGPGPGDRQRDRPDHGGDSQADARGDKSAPKRGIRRFLGAIFRAAARVPPGGPTPGAGE